MCEKFYDRLENFQCIFIGTRERISYGGWMGFCVFCQYYVYIWKISCRSTECLETKTGFNAREILL